MLRLRRRPVKTHARLAKDELSESLEHLARAANHAAGGVGATVGPRVHAAREKVGPAAGKMRSAAVAGLGTTATALAPLAVAAREGSRMARRRKARGTRQTAKRSSGRMPRTVLLAAGAVVGVAGAVIMRRRRQQRWGDEYEVERPIESAADEAEAALHRAEESASTTAESLAEKASSAIGSGQPEAGTAAGTPAPGMATPVPVVESPSRNSRS